MYHYSTATIADNKDHVASIKIRNVTSPVGPLRYFRVGVGFGEYTDCTNAANPTGQIIAGILVGIKTALPVGPVDLGTVTPSFYVGKSSAAVALLDRTDGVWGTFDDYANATNVELQVRYAPVSGILSMQVEIDGGTTYSGDVARCLNCDAALLQKAGFVIGDALPGFMQASVVLDDFDCNQGDAFSVALL